MFLTHRAHNTNSFGKKNKRKFQPLFCVCSCTSYWFSLTNEWKWTNDIVHGAWHMIFIWNILIQNNIYIFSNMKTNRRNRTLSIVMEINDFLCDKRSPLARIRWIENLNLCVLPSFLFGCIFNGIIDTRRLPMAKWLVLVDSRFVILPLNWQISKTQSECNNIRRGNSSYVCRSKLKHFNIDSLRMNHFDYLD